MITLLFHYKNILLISNILPEKDNHESTKGARPKRSLVNKVRIGRKHENPVNPVIGRLPRTKREHE